LRETPIERLYVQPAAGDGGGRSELRSTRGTPRIPVPTDS